MDTVDADKRSWIMAQIRSKGNLSTEKKLEQLFRRERLIGWRRKTDLPGKPDFVFPKQKLAIFVDGCFWHGHPTRCRLPKTNTSYWAEKILRNRLRDRIVTRSIKNRGWKVLRIWEHLIEHPETLAKLRLSLNQSEIPK